MLQYYRKTTTPKRKEKENNGYRVTSIIQVWNIGSFSLLKFYISAIRIVNHSESVNCTKYLQSVSFFILFVGLKYYICTTAVDCAFSIF